MIMKKHISILTFTAILLTGLHASATKLFSISAIAGANNVTVENHSLPNLIKDLIKGEGDFSGLKGQPRIQGSLTYFGLPKSLNIDVDRSDAQIIKLHITSILTDVDKEFVASDGDDLAKQLIEWFYLDGGDAAAELLQAIILVSGATVTDGSPGSTTAQMADTTFQMFGFYAIGAHNGNMRGFKSGAHVGLWFNADSFEINTPSGLLQGTRWRATIPLWLHFNKRISLIGNTHIDSSNIEGTEFYGLGADIGIGVRPIVRTTDKRFGWQITPYLGAYGIGSADGVTAAVVSQFGLVNRLEWRVFDRSLIAFVSQFTTFDNIAINFGDIELVSPIDQDLIKNGLMYEFPIIGKSFYGNINVIDSRFLKDARTDNFQTYGAGLSYRLTRFSLQGNIGYDDSAPYSGVTANIGAVWDL